MSDLLPINATVQERAISTGMSREVPVVVREMWNPDTCPAALLPWLAWALSVDQWNPSWTDEQKRGAIKASTLVHQQKGTVGALRSALSAIGYDVELKEWFQMDPLGDPYTFALNIDVNQVGIPLESDHKSIEAVAQSTKNLRSHLTGISITAICLGRMYLGTLSHSGDIITVFEEPTA